MSTVPALLLDRVARSPDGGAFLVPDGVGWSRISWREFGIRVTRLAAGLRALGLQEEERCAILSSTRYEWIAADLATLCAGGATTTIYPSSTPAESAFILQDSGSAFVFAESEEQVQKLRQSRASTPGLRKVVVFDGASSADGWAITLAELEELGRSRLAADPGEVERISRAVKPTQLATLIYTSGTTGRPKGVELTHDNWAYEAEAIDSLGLLRPDDVQYLWLPLSHSFGKVLEVAQLRIGFVTAVDGRVDKLVDNLGAVRPTFVAAVPRIFEKVHARVVAGAAEGGAVKESIFRWAFAVGGRVSSLRRQGRTVPPLLAAQNALATRLVFSKLQQRFGGRLRFFVSGSAPLSAALAEFFHAAGVLILEGYGLTETSAASFVNLPSRFRFGTVGPALPGTEVTIAADGEVLIRGRGVMRGYHGLPEETAATLDPHGYLHTGDIGVYEDGFLRITDRKKDLIKTSGGKYVAPQAIEGKLKLACPLLSQVLVHGNNRNFCTALVSLDPEAAGKWAAEHGLGALSYAELARNAKVREAVSACVDQLNAELASFETIKRFAVLPDDLTVESGDLTPSMKLKRKAVEAKYGALLEGFYR